MRAHWAHLSHQSINKVAFDCLYWKRGGVAVVHANTHRERKETRYGRVNNGLPSLRKLTYSRRKMKRKKKKKISGLLTHERVWNHTKKRKRWQWLSTKQVFKWTKFAHSYFSTNCFQPRGHVPQHPSRSWVVWPNCKRPQGSIRGSQNWRYLHSSPADNRWRNWNVKVKEKSILK